MYKLCKTEQSAMRQRQLEQGLLQLMQTKRYEEISISDLCQRMGMPRKTFYRYFDGIGASAGEKRRVGWKLREHLRCGNGN